MPFRLPIPIVTRTEGFSLRIIHPHGEGVSNIKSGRTKEYLQIFLGMMVYFSSYIPFYVWIAAPLFNLLRKDTRWEWIDLHTKALELCKQVLTNTPVREYVVPGSPYQLYSDTCNFGSHRNTSTSSEI